MSESLRTRLNPTLLESDFLKMCCFSGENNPLMRIGLIKIRVTMLPVLVITISKFGHECF